MSLLTMLAVIIAGIMISLKSSPAIGGAVVGLAKGAGMLMLGGAGKAAMGLAKMTDKATGSRASTGLQNLKSGYGTALERVGLRATGTTAGANAKQVDDVAGTLSKEYAAAKATGNTGSMDRVHALATKGRGAQAAAAMKVLADNKDLGNAFKGPTALNDMANRMKYAELNGAVGIREKAEKLDPRLKAFNDVEANKIMQPISKGGRGITNRDVAGTTLVNEGYSKASVSDIREYSTDTLANTAFINNVDGRKIAKAGEEMSSAKVAAIKNHKNELMTQMAAAHASGNHAEYNKLSKKMGNVMGL